ncbi:phosphatase PAP2 family protein [Solitalea koreensis]|uniref:Membrane-associated phospholipid phosphatase n=1 Tax=Solitalea koreensis TaxID=543615 RepID=A0A521C9F3_9SPHI|nr:phosphatase PAP2 family protein [Solitalea koreensis]SMO56079.1 Membrane-associated phospholipid phosphatase [Solitalea koreensis]
MKAIIIQLRFFLVAYLLFLIAAIILYLAEGHAGSFLLINGAHTGWTDQFFKYFTYVGDGTFFGILIIAYLFTDRKRSWLTFLTLVITTILANLIKHQLFPHTLRPKTYFNDDRLLHFVNGVVVHSYGSFPSGHSISAFSIAMLCTYFSKDKHLGAVYALMAALVGYSRIYLAQHFLLDVIMGSLIGVIATFGCILFVSKIRIKIQKPVFKRMSDREGKDITAR